MIEHGRGMDGPGAGGPAKSRVSGAPPLELRELEVPFGKNPGLSGISFKVEKGERFALVGASGAGKTSLLRAVSGSDNPQNGKIFVEGRDVSNLPPEKRGMVLLSQRPLLFPHLSVSENIAFPLKVRGVGRGETSRRVEGALAAVQLEGYGPRSPQSLSGGQAHRAALARAVVARPPVLLLDEPLTSLDPSLREEVRQSIRRVQEEYGPALVLVTHDLEEAGRMADKIGVLMDGTLAQVASPSSLFRQPSSIAVARFLGFPNEVSGEVTPEGDLVLAGVTVGKTEVEPGSVLAVFGADAGRVTSECLGGLRARVDRIHHYPGGATAEVTLLGPDTPPGDVAPGHIPPPATAIEVSADPTCPPEPGQKVELVFHPERMSVFPRMRDERE